MAEGLARSMAPEGVSVYSAGLEPKGVHLLAIRVMSEVGIDISAYRSKDLDGVSISQLDTVITLCGNAEERCPVFSGQVKRLHWGLDDPAEASGGEEEVLAVFRRVRDEIKGKLVELLKEL